MAIAVIRLRLSKKGGDVYVRGSEVNQQSKNPFEEETNLMKRKFSSIGRVAMVLVLALTLGLVMAVPVSATHTSSAIVDFAAPPVSTIAGEASILDVTVTNAAGSAGKITTVKIDFTASDFAVTGAGTLPGSWTATGPIAKVVTYTYATGIAKGASVIFSPAVTNPTEAGPAAVPAVKTTDAGSKAAVTAAPNTGWIGYVADSAGSGGNDITVAYVDPGMVSRGLSVSVVVKAITVSL
ncbi:hypothetical protein KKF82_07010, partial [Patescibacteria group bacterium]|nr:hypothetical protein [Patescibacteria group bacterium]